MSYFSINGHAYFDDCSRLEPYSTSLYTAVSKMGFPSSYHAESLMYRMSDEVRTIFGEDSFLLEDIFNFRTPVATLAEEYYAKIEALNWYFCNSVRLYFLPLLLEDYVAFAKKKHFTYCWLADYVSEKLR